MITHLTHTFLQNFNWLSDQGIHLSMINSQSPPGRNEFYDRIISRSVQDRRCIDIGFGTGLLSMLALKHGARHVDAWEYDSERHALGVCIIKELGLQDRITLHHGQFHADYLEDQNCVVIHEIIGGNIWNEGLRHAIPLAANKILPGGIKVEFDLLQISQGTCREIFFPDRNFDPKVDLLPGFKECVQRFIDATPQFQTARRHHCRREDFDTRIKCLHLDPIVFYEIDFNKKFINKIPMGKDGIPPKHQMQYIADVPTDQVWIYYPRTSIQHQNNMLHWKWHDPILVDHPGCISIEQDFNNGQFEVGVID